MTGTTTQQLGLGALLVAGEIEFPEGSYPPPLDPYVSDETDCWSEPWQPSCQEIE